MIWRSFLLANLRKIAVASTVLAQYAIERFLTLPAQRLSLSIYSLDRLLISVELNCYSIMYHFCKTFHRCTKNLFFCSSLCIKNEAFYASQNVLN